MRFDEFICPVCGASLERSSDGRSLRCERRHSFDIARQGYVSLVTGSRGRPVGDTAAMTQARASFLASGLYEPVAQALAETVEQSSALDAASTSARRMMADLGGGTGYYSAYVLDRLAGLDGVLLDASAPAAKIAARAHPRLSVATADLWRSIPLATGSCAIALVVFAPRHPSEIARILSPGGACVVVTPAPDHLSELRATFPLLNIDPHKEERLIDQFAGFVSGPPRALTYRRRFDPANIADVISMGPAAFHTTAAAIADLAQKTGPMEVTVSVMVHIFSHH